MIATTAAFRRPDGAGRLDGVVGDRLHRGQIHQAGLVAAGIDRAMKSPGFGPSEWQLISPHFKTEKECNNVLKHRGGVGQEVPRPLPPGRKLRRIPLSYRKIGVGGAEIQGGGRPGI